MATPNEDTNASPSKTFTTHPKSGKRKPNKKALSKQSIAVSMLSSIDAKLALEGLLDGEKVHTSFDCPLNLRERFKQEVWANGETECEVLQALMVDYIISVLIKKHATAGTLSKIKVPEVHVGEINLHQHYDRPRRNPDVAESAPEPAIPEQTAPRCDICYQGEPCGKPAYAKATYHRVLGVGNYRDTEHFVCEKHYRERVVGVKDWSNVVLLASSNEASGAKFPNKTMPSKEEAP